MPSGVEITRRAGVELVRPGRRTPRSRRFLARRRDGLHHVALAVDEPAGRRRGAPRGARVCGSSGRSRRAPTGARASSCTPPRWAACWWSWSRAPLREPRRPPGGRARRGPDRVRRRPLRHHGARRPRRRRGQGRAPRRATSTAARAPCSPRAASPPASSRSTGARRSRGAGPARPRRAGPRLGACWTTPTCWSRTGPPARWSGWAWATRTCTSATRGWSTCSISGFGQTGPDAPRGGYDLVLQARERPAVDDRPARQAARRRSRSPRSTSAAGSTRRSEPRGAARARPHGRTAPTSRPRCWNARWRGCRCTWSPTASAATSRSPEGTRSPFFAPYEAYRTGDGHLVVVGTGGDDAWGRLCGALGLRTAREDPRFADNARRVENAEELRALIEGVMTGGPTAHWVAVLGAAGRGLRAGAGRGGRAGDRPGAGARHRGRAGRTRPPGRSRAWACRCRSTASGPSRRGPPPLLDDDA